MPLKNRRTQQLFGEWTFPISGRSFTFLNSVWREEKGWTELRRKVEKWGREDTHVLRQITEELKRRIEKLEGRIEKYKIYIGFYLTFSQN